MRYAFALLLLASPVYAGGGIYKCVLEGHTVYTQVPCYSDEPPMDLPPPNTEAAMPAPSNAELAKRYDKDLAEQKALRNLDDDIFVRQVEVARERANAVRAAVLSHRVLKGMDRSQVESALGPPAQVDGNRHVYVQNGQQTTVIFGRQGVTSVATKTITNKGPRNGRRNRRKNP